MQAKTIIEPRKTSGTFLAILVAVAIHVLLFAALSLSLELDAERDTVAAGHGKLAPLPQTAGNRSILTSRAVAPDAMPEAPARIEFSATRQSALRPLHRTGIHSQ